eukprot:3581888-Prymnesium_polylepis.1
MREQQPASARPPSHACDPSLRRHSHYSATAISPPFLSPPAIPTSAPAASWPLVLSSAAALLTAAPLAAPLRLVGILRVDDAASSAVTNPLLLTARDGPIRPVLQGQIPALQTPANSASIPLALAGPIDKIFTPSAARLG